jgi:hypothetical protein
MNGNAWGMAGIGSARAVNVLQGIRGRRNRINDPPLTLICIKKVRACKHIMKGHSAGGCFHDQVD